MFMDSCFLVRVSVCLSLPWHYLWLCVSVSMPVTLPVTMCLCLRPACDTTCGYVSLPLCLWHYLWLCVSVWLPSYLLISLWFCFCLFTRFVLNCLWTGQPVFRPLYSSRSSSCAGELADCFLSERTSCTLKTKCLMLSPLVQTHYFYIWDESVTRLGAKCCDWRCCGDGNRLRGL